MSVDNPNQEAIAWTDDLVSSDRVDGRPGSERLRGRTTWFRATAWTDDLVPSDCVLIGVPTTLSSTPPTPSTQDGDDPRLLRSFICDETVLDRLEEASGKVLTPSTSEYKARDQRRLDRAFQKDCCCRPSLRCPFPTLRRRRSRPLRLHLLFQVQLILF
jgi:hypothetical protein